jgi:predicted enzyme involved in methoxymalonyl-ACP biosynthesis
VNFAKKEKCPFLKGEYIETAKNEMVKNHYPALGFEASGNYWLLNVDAYNTRECFIKNK